MSLRRKRRLRRRTWRRRTPQRLRLVQMANLDQRRKGKSRKLKRRRRRRRSKKKAKAQKENDEKKDATKTSTGSDGKSGSKEEKRKLDQADVDEKAFKRHKKEAPEASTLGQTKRKLPGGGDKGSAQDKKQRPEELKPTRSQDSEYIELTLFNPYRLSGLNDTVMVYCMCCIILFC